MHDLLADTETSLSDVETELRLVATEGLSDHEYHRARRVLVRYLGQLCGLSSSEKSSLPDAIEASTRCSDSGKRRTAAIVVTRVASCPGVLPQNDASNLLHRKVVDLFEKNLPDIARKLFDKNVTQTYEKYEAITNVHQSIVETLKIVKSVPADAKLLLANRQEITKAISTELNSAYLNPFEQKKVKSSLTHIFTALQETINTSDFSFASKLEQLKQFLAGEIEWCGTNRTFFTEEFYSVVLHALQEALVEFEKNQEGRFSCELTPKRHGRDIADKHYPLHDTERMVKVSVLLTNSGPGVALDVQVELLTDSNEPVVFDERIGLGDINPGDHPFMFDLMVSAPVDEVSFVGTLSWLEANIVVRKSTTFELRLIGQNPLVDWKGLKTRHPYSTEVAEGDEFVGRTQKVQSLANRLLKDRMISSFITGQKRVGKTSLAHAVERYIAEESVEFCRLYLEYGQYSAMDPIETLENLGNEIAEFLLDELSEELHPKALNLRGSLAPLSKIADLLLKERPTKRFIFILDEFDEIPPEMYRYGALAETFFANLRTLSAKRNIAFLLVGGEKMPFVMSAQGDQLNKFVSEKLDYFVKGEEWSDYAELVRKPVKDELNWSDSSLQQLFDQTNGHPYYTKLLCAKIFSIAVSERDSEITDGDVRHSINKIIPELGGNSFAHLWKDGISEDRDKAEILELQRRRVLSACARTLRAKEHLSIENVSKNKFGLQISDAQVATIFNDFVRRGIMSEEQQSKHVNFSIPLFARWLEEVGTSQLMSDALAEEYESAEQQAEEMARITSAEIVALTESWSPYRGMDIGNEAVRAWLDQVKSNKDKRLLFQLLRNLRFVTRAEVRESLKQAHNMLGEHLPPLYQERKNDRRKDVLVTWVDGAGKSGNTYAALYTEQNKISSKCLCAPEGFVKALNDHEERTGSSIRAIVIVDDFVGTGDSLSSNLGSFVSENASYIRERNIKVLAVAVTATVKGEQKVRTQISSLGIDVDFRVCEPLRERHFAFSDGLGFWASAEEKGRAKELCQRLGANLHRQNPLGYGNQGLLLVFPETCPNNSLPILHASSSGQEPWKPLFARPKN